MANPSSSKPRIGVSFRTRKEQSAGDRLKIQRYTKAIELGGGDPVEIRLDLSSDELNHIVEDIDAVVLSGSPADIDPMLFQAEPHPKTAERDADRERTDFALLKHCFAVQKPVLAICYGIQSLNVFLGGTLIQDIPSEMPSAIAHDAKSGAGLETFHAARIEPGSRLAEIAHGSLEVRINSSHHQSVLKAGRGLRVTAHAPDGVIEAMEGTAAGHWVTAVQWHPERMVETDSLALSLFQELAAAARRAPVRA